MFVPDDAKARRISDKLPPAAWLVYEAHCQRRHNKGRTRGLSFATKEEIATSEGLSLKTVWNATTLLRKKGWIKDEGKAVRLLVGDFLPVDKKHLQPAPAPPSPSPDRESDDDEIPQSGNSIPDLGNEIPQSGKEIPDTGNGAYIGSHARSDQPSPAITSTHTPAEDGRAVQGEDAPAARVGVSQGTRCANEQIAAYARAFGLGLGWIRTARQTGECDDWIEEFNADPEGFVLRWGVRNAQPPVRADGDSATDGDATMRDLAAHELDELVQGVAAVVEVQGRDPAQVIAELVVTESDRERLRLRLQGQAVQARAHAPP